MSSVRDVFALEVVKLLLQVAWADHEVSPEEAEHLIGQARQAGIAEEHLAELRSYLSGDAPLPPPNLGLLKERRVEVLRKVKSLLQSDLEVAPEEDAILEQISTLLR
jgi:uncharacterized tellurite resistance protein B-like protein